MVVQEREGRKVCCARVQGNEWKRVTEKERETETKDEVRARVVFERDTVASHREETVAGLPQGCLHRRGVHTPFFVLHRVSFHFFFFWFYYYTMFRSTPFSSAWSTYRGDGCRSTVARFRVETCHRLRGTSYERLDKQWCDVLLWLFALIVIVQGKRRSSIFIVNAILTWKLTGFAIRSRESVKCRSKCNFGKIVRTMEKM